MNLCLYDFKMKNYSVKSIALAEELIEFEAIIFVYLCRYIADRQLCVFHGPY